MKNPSEPSRLMRYDLGQCVFEARRAKRVIEEPFALSPCPQTVDAVYLGVNVGVRIAQGLVPSPNHDGWVERQTGVAN